FISIDKRIVENLLERILVFYSKKFNFTSQRKDLNEYAYQYLVWLGIDLFLWIEIFLMQNEII
ncbi:hypothetical protein, partial [Campylobacter coli]